MNPVTYAQALAKKQGPVHALEMAEYNSQMMDVALTLGGSPFADEVEIQEQTYVDKETSQQKTRTITIINEVKKDKRLKSTQVFWKNVVSYLKKRQPKGKDAK